MQLFFLVHTSIWNLNQIAMHHTITRIIKCMPFTYLVTGIRDCFMEGNIITAGHGIYTIIFWVITIIMFIWGNYIFKRSKKILQMYYKKERLKIKYGRKYRHTISNI